jgi:hypothetical protein
MSANGKHRVSIADLVKALGRLGPMTAGSLGFELWGTPGARANDENTQATMFTRTATRMLYQAEARGLVRWRQHGRTRVWEAVAG